MSEYTTRQILDMIEENGGPEGLDLSGADLEGIDLGRETIQAELEKARRDDPEGAPAWGSEFGGINLAETNLEGAELSGANLQGGDLLQANLRGVKLLQGNLQGADLTEANLEGAQFWRANLQEARLLYSNLQGAYLGGADLEGTQFWRANLQEARLSYSNLQDASLSGANLHNALLGGADLRGSFFYRARLDHTEIERQSLGPAVGEELTQKYDRARDAYLRLKQNFDALGDYAASAWAYQKERQMEKKCNAPWRARSIYGTAELGEEPSLARVFWFYARHTVKWILDWIVEYLCGYGENPIRVLLWMAASLLGFATYYWSIDAVWLVDPGKGPIATASSFWHYLIYSVGAFTTTQFGTFQAADDRVRLVTGIQAIWGIFLAGLLGFVVANKIRRS